METLPNLAASRVLSPARHIDDYAEAGARY